MTDQQQTGSSTSSPSLKLDPDIQIDIVQSNEKFEDLLATNNLFVDYLNAFLANPILGEKLKFNFVTGELEIIEGDADEYEAKNRENPNQPAPKTENEIKNLVKTKMEKAAPPKTSSSLGCTAEGVKKKLETQLKSIIKNRASAQTPQNPKLPSALSSINPNLTTTSRLTNDTSALLAIYDRPHTDMSFTNKNRTSSANRRREMYNQVNNHSFKDIDLIPIESRIDPSELKDPKHAIESKIPVVNTKYMVNVLKKPYSMKWLRNRRLTLFLQSELYSEFKLAMILSQFSLFNNDLIKAIPQSELKKIRYIQVELEKELVDMQLNPFNAKNDLEKLHETHDPNLNGEPESDSVKIKSDKGSSSPIKNSSMSIDETPLNKSDELESKKQELKQYYESDFSESELEEDEAENNDDEEIEKIRKAVQSKKESKFLIENYKDVYKSFDSSEKLKTSLLINKSQSQIKEVKLNLEDDSRNTFEVDPEKIKLADDSIKEMSLDEKEESRVIVKSVNEMARLLVGNIVHQAVGEVAATNSSSEIEKNFEKHYRYTLSAKTVRKLGYSNDSKDFLNDFNVNKSASKLSYYKEYNTDYDLSGKDVKKDVSYDDENDEEKFLLEFEDEPYELTDSQHFDEVLLRRVEIENFKNFLKDNDAFIYYKLWIDIDKLYTIVNQADKTNYIKQLKLTYNHPQILNKLNTDNNSTESKKAKYYNMYAQFEKNIDFWSYEYLTRNLQKRLLHTLTNYWWPKYCIRLNSFQDYVKNKYPVYFRQKNLINHKSRGTNDLDVENIEKSLTYKEDLSKKERDMMTIEEKLLGNRKKLGSRVKIYESESVLLAKRKVTNKKPKSAGVYLSNDGKKEKTANKRPNLEGYDFDHFKTSPPVGWKRPPSRATLLAKAILENKENTLSSRDTVDTRQSSAKLLNKQQVKRNRLDKEIYLEAIYREDIAGQIFMKYLNNKNKLFAVNRLKCLQDMIKYKDLFYDENFNQEIAKKYALELYSKYIAVSANYSIDCPKADRLKIHYLFSDSNQSNNIGTINAKSVYRPVYEDTFDAIEEFLLVSLYDEWKVLMETEENFFNHNEIENIERSVNIRSKKIDELLGQGLIRMEPKSANPSIGYGSRKVSINDMSGVFGQNSSTTWENQSSLSLKNKTFDLNELINNTRDLEMFKKFLENQNALNDLLCWMDIEAYSRIESGDYDQIEDHARMLKKRYFNKKYFFAKKGPIDEETQNIILEKIGGWNVILDDIPPNSLIILAKKYLERKLKTVWLPMYYNSDYCTKSDYATRTQMMDVVDDVLYLKNRYPITKEHAKVKKRRWLYSSQMIINFGKALRNSFTTKVFSKFLTFKSNPSSINDFDMDTNNNLVNDLQFLVEVLDYKELCQKKPDDDRAILFKMNHIIDCFINNRIPPKCRIDLPQETINNILDQKDYISPYLFLDANLIVFNTLMPYWVEFNQMRSGKEMDLFDEFSSFKKMKDYNGSKRGGSAASHDESSHDDHNKWRYHQYIKALKTQLVV